jgi:vacuolar protein sorting-associated protein 72
VVGGGFVWSGDLGCYVGGRAKPLESMGGKGFLGMPPAAGVPRRFLEMQKKTAPPPAASGETQGQTPAQPQDVSAASTSAPTPAPAPAPTPGSGTAAVDASSAPPAPSGGGAIKNETMP